jgi:hypothetical protein
MQVASLRENSCSNDKICIVYLHKNDFITNIEDFNSSINIDDIILSSFQFFYNVNFVI